MVAELEGQPFATYAEYGPGVLLTPEAEEALRANIADRVACGQVAAALNLSQTEERLIVQSQIGRICDDHGLPWRTFRSYAEAKPWLLQRIGVASGTGRPGHCATGLFAPHGEYRLETDDRIIKVTAAGATNREAILRFSAEIAELVAGFGGRPFALYSAYDADVILTLEAEERLRKSITERARLGMCAAVLNVSNSMHPMIVSGQIGGLYDEAGVPWRTFDDYESARDWLLERVAAAEATDRPPGRGET